MLVEICYRDRTSEDDADAVDYRFELYAWPSRRRIRGVRARVHSDDEMDWVQRLESRGAKGEEAEARLRQAVLLASVHTLELMGPALLEGDAVLTVPLTQEDLDVVVQQGKTCSYQDRRGRDLFCTAANDDMDPSSFSASTSLYACQNVCTLPDTRWLCSSFCHAGVEILSGPASVKRARRLYEEVVLKDSQADYRQELKAWKPMPTVLDRICDRGQTEVLDESRCVPGGHPCWHRTIDLSNSKTDATGSACI